MNMRLTIAIGLSTLAINAFACECKFLSLKENQETSFNTSDLIFIGDVMEIDTVSASYRVKIVEVLKGNTTSEWLNGITTTSCSGFPTPGLWIIYCNPINSETIEFDECGMSRSFANPESVNVTDYKISAPPKTSTGSTTTDSYLHAYADLQTIKVTALEDLRQEIEALRKRR